MEMQSTTEPKNNNYQKMDGYNDSSSWHIISIVSWSLMLITQWASYHYGFFIWTGFENRISSRIGSDYFPISMNLSWLFIYLFLIAALAFGVYMVFTTCKRNQSLYDGMQGSLSRYHFIPLLLIASIYIIALNSGKGQDLKYTRKILIFDLIFTILGLISLIFIYIVTQLNTEWYFVLSIKKGMYSTFIIILWYNFFHIIISLQSIKYILDGKYHYGLDEDDPITKFYKVVGILFAILFGLGCLCFSLLFKDIMAAFTTFLIYLGMIEAFFTGDKSDEENKKELFNGVADGVLDIIFMILSLACIFFLALRCRERLF